MSDHEHVVTEPARALAPGGRLLARLGGAGNQAAMTVAALWLFDEPPYRDYRPVGLHAPWTMGDPALWAAALPEHGLVVDDIDLVPSPSGWTSAQDVAERAWPRIHPDRAFVRLVVRAHRGG